MRPGLNKKVLVFVDEYGTAGQGDLYLGAVFVLARDAGRLDKRFSDLLEPSAGEIHAVDLRDGYLQGLLDRFWREASAGRVTLLNGKVAERGAPCTAPIPSRVPMHSASPSASGPKSGPWSRHDNR